MDYFKSFAVKRDIGCCLSGLFDVEGSGGKGEKFSAVTCSTDNDAEVSETDFRDNVNPEFAQLGRLPRTSRHLIIGAGQLGKALERELTKARFPVRLLYRNELPLENPDKLAKIVSAEVFNVVWLTAAATDVDWCESNADEAFRLNAHAPREIAEICAQSALKLIHFSTDYVFSGIENGDVRTVPYLESDKVSPLSVYGASKAESERLVFDVNQTATVVRTSGLYSVSGRCFFNAIYEKGVKGEKVSVVDDQVTSPTNVSLLAEWLCRHFHQLPCGLIHLASKGGVSWRRAAEVSFELCGFRRDLVIGITSEVLGRPAKRPLYSALGSRVLQNYALRSLPNWLEGLSRWATEKTKLGDAK